ncbi:MAG: SPOR domain-containing protein [Candidatus Neomarinimicrobiota bacterium]|tara:strand:- start:220 stop:654 length:435 start_codon:yes stop_codon:yes gene_type:complete
MLSKKYFFFVSIFSFIMAQNPNEINQKKLKDILPRWPVIVNNALDDSTSFDKVLKKDSTQLISEGYRVQILATRYYEYADSIAISISNRITDSVYVEYETPNYKVRVGDFINRDAAEFLQQELFNLGYKSAWILRSRITAQRAE